MIGGDAGPSRLRMPHRRSIRYVVVAVALLALLGVAITFGGVLHHHQNSTSENTCQICHLNHQPIARPLASDRIPVLAPMGAQPEPEDYEFSLGLFCLRLPARAPPTA
jgi:hypothetical protein